VARQGELVYTVRGGATPTGPGSVRWRMTYTTRHGDTVLDEAGTAYDWWPASVEVLATELRETGLVPEVDGDLVIARHLGPAG
jgi:hypothetical protein